MESVFSTVKIEPADRFASLSEAKMALSDYIEVLYTARRCPLLGSSCPPSVPMLYVCTVLKKETDVSKC